MSWPQWFWWLWIAGPLMILLAAWLLFSVGSFLVNMAKATMRGK